jgi:hypothetical protein
MKIKVFLLLFIICNNLNAQNSDKDSKAIKVLNFATFHLTNTTDANSSVVDINNPKVKGDIDKIVQKLIEFKPTIICVEIPKQYSQGSNDIYQEYKIDQSRITNWSEEINSIAFEVGRLSGVDSIYGIDFPIGFDYPKLMEMAEISNSPLTIKFLEKYSKNLEKYNELSLIGKFQALNSAEWRSETLNHYNFLSTMHSKENWEGVEIVSEFYKRNLAIYSNFYEIPKKETDRVLIILGGTHSAFLDVFLKNDDNFEIVDPKEFVVQ